MGYLSDKDGQEREENCDCFSDREEDAESEKADEETATGPDSNSNCGGASCPFGCCIEANASDLHH